MGNKESGSQGTVGGGNEKGHPDFQMIGLFLSQGWRPG